MVSFDPSVTLIGPNGATSVTRMFGDGTFFDAEEENLLAGTGDSTHSFTLDDLGFFDASPEEQPFPEEYV